MFSPDTVRLKFSQTLGGIKSPSDTVKNPNNLKAAVEAPGGPRYGRPSDRYGPPTALFDKALAVLQYDFDHLESLTPSTMNVRDAFDLVSLSAGFFSGEDVREVALRTPLQALLPDGGKWQEPMVGGAVKPDGTWLEGFFVYMILETKNEPGLGGDPFAQGLAVYTKIINQEQVLYPPPPPAGSPSTDPYLDQYSRFCSQSNLPIVLLSIAGNRLEVATAIFTEAVYADKLLSFDLRLGPHGPDNVLRVARIFMAITKCANGLRKLYGRLKETSTILPSVIYPNPTADPPESPIPQLEFFYKMNRAEGIPIKGAIDADNERHAIYLAKMKSDPSTGDSSTRDVLVKFSAKYNEAAHMLLASQDPPLAPALYSCTRVVGGLYMVVMEYVSDAKPLHHFFYSSALSSPPTAEVIRQDLTKALDLLGGRDFVFGDLRQVNILYSPDKDRAYLVDFDGVGKHGEDRYSPCLNPKAGLGVERWQIMEKKHDRENLERVMEWLSEGLSLISQ